MALTFCYLASTVFAQFSITVSHFNKHKICFSKWYSTLLYLEYFRNNSKKSKKVPKQFLHNFTIFFQRYFSLKFILLFSVKSSFSSLIMCKNYILSNNFAHFYQMYTFDGYFLRNSNFEFMPLMEKLIRHVPHNHFK